MSEKPTAMSLLYLATVMHKTQNSVAYSLSYEKIHVRREVYNGDWASAVKLQKKMKKPMAVLYHIVYILIDFCSLFC